MYSYFIRSSTTWIISSKTNLKEKRLSLTLLQRALVTSDASLIYGEKLKH